MWYHVFRMQNNSRQNTKIFVSLLMFFLRKKKFKPFVESEVMVSHVAAFSDALSHSLHTSWITTIAEKFISLSW
jgi:hypothetical protein